MRYTMRLELVEDDDCVVLAVKKSSDCITTAYNSELVQALEQLGYNCNVADYEDRERGVIYEAVWIGIDDVNDAELQHMLDEDKMRWIAEQVQMLLKLATV